MTGADAGGERRGTAPLDLRLAVLALLGWVVAYAVLLLGAARGTVVVGVAAGTLLVAARNAARGPVTSAWVATLLAAAAVVVACGGVSAMRVAAVRPAAVRALVAHGGSARVDLVVIGDPAPLVSRFPHAGPPRVRVGCRLELVRTSEGATVLRVPVTVFAPGSWSGLLPGTRVRATATFGSSRYRDEAALVLVRGPPQVVRGPDVVQRAAGSVRAGLRAAVAGLPADPRGLVPGMVLGDTSAVPARLVVDERVAGLTHLTAVSGANVAVLLAAVLGASRATGLGRRARSVVGVLAVVGFVVLARPSASVLRAAVMGCVVLLGLLRGPVRRGPQVLAGAVLALLLVDPWLAASVGFALSVTATAAILLVAPLWRARLDRHLPTAVAEPLAVASVAHLATVPLIVGLSGHVSLVAVAANVAADPAVVPVTVAGAVAAVVSPVSPTAAAWCARPAGWGAWWVAEVAHHAAHAPLAQVGWPAGTPALAGLVVACGAVLLLAPRVAVRVPIRRSARPAGGAWHASRDVPRTRPAAGRDPRRRPRGPPRRARGGAGRHRRARR